jgi:hypothetical protein
MHQDTVPSQQEAYFQRLRLLSPEQRLVIVSRLNRGVRRMALAGLRLRHPGASEEDLRLRLFVRLHVPEDAV